jgi:hypothetical protein
MHSIFASFLDDFSDLKPFMSILIFFAQNIYDQNLTRFVQFFNEALQTSKFYPPER